MHSLRVKKGGAFDPMETTTKNWNQQCNLLFKESGTLDPIYTIVWVKLTHIVPQGCHIWSHKRQLEFDKLTAHHMFTGAGAFDLIVRRNVSQGTVYPNVPFLASLSSFNPTIACWGCALPWFLVPPQISCVGHAATFGLGRTCLKPSTIDVVFFLHPNSHTNSGIGVCRCVCVGVCVWGNHRNWINHILKEPCPVNSQHDPLILDIVCIDSAQWDLKFGEKSQWSTVWFQLSSLPDCIRMLGRFTTIVGSSHNCQE